MPRGIPELKRRNGSQRARRARSKMWINIYAAAQTHVNEFYRRAVGTDVFEPITMREGKFAATFAAEYQVNARIAPYANKTGMLIKEMERGARLFTADAEYKIKRVPVDKK